MGPVWGAAIALSGVFLTQYLAYRFRKQDRSWRIADETRARMVERGEELYTAIFNWNKALGTHFIFYSQAMRGHISYNDALDAVIAAGEKENIKIDRMEMVLNIYFPDLANQFEACRAIVQAASAVEGEFRNLYRQNSGVDGEQHARRYQALLLQSEKSLNALLESLATEIRGISSAH